MSLGKEGHPRVKKKIKIGVIQILKKSSRGCKDLGSLGLAAALVGGHVATTTTGSKATTALTLETTATLAASAVTTATSTTTAGEAIATKGIATRTALLNDDLLAANLVGVGSDGSSVGGRLSKLNESAVLKYYILVKISQDRDMLGRTMDGPWDG